MEKKILETFLYNEKLKFNEIEKILGARSNKLAYYLKKLLNKEILKKDNDYYRLNEKHEHIIPYITDRKSILPVILISIKKDKENIFLHKRKKRPFKGKLSLPGGRILLKESIKQATKRIMKEKFRIKCKFKKINSISLEHVKKQNKILHSFILIFVSATTNQKLNYTNISKNKSGIISSDYNLIKNHLNKKIEMKELVTITN